MRVVVDARPAVFPQKTGVGYYTWHLLKHLPRVDPSTRYMAWYLNARALAGGPRRYLTDLPGVKERWTPIPARWFERMERIDLPKLEWLVRFDVLFAPNFVPPPTDTRRLVVTVHDLAFRRFPETAPQATRSWLARLDRVLHRAARIIAVSETTKRDLVDLYAVPEERVTVVPNGVDREAFYPAPPDQVQGVRRRFGIEGPYLLYLGGIEPRKNLPNLVRAYARLDSDRPALVVAGGGVAWNPEGGDALRQALDELPPETRGSVVVTGYVGEQEKVALFTGSEALVYPSSYEGFGLPVLEAMACGAPVITSTVSALPGVAGDAALLVDPDDPDEIARGIMRVLGEPGLAEDLRRRGLARVDRFTWEETARRTAAVLHEAARS